MKILHIITSMHVGGAEKLIAEMVPLMKGQGHQTDVLLFDGTDTPLKQSLKKKGICVYELSQNSSVYHPYLIFKLIKYLNQYDIIHTHNTACQLFVILASLFICKKNRPQFITTEHSTTNRRRNKKYLKWLDRWMYRNYNQIVAISDKAKEYLQNYLASSTISIHVIYNGINIQEFQKPSDLILKKNEKDIILVMVAGFRKGKDQKTIIKAIQILPDNYHLYLVGDGILRKEHEDLVQSLFLQDRVHFLGIRNDIPAILKASDIIIMSSEYEGLSLSSIEGMASGKPFIASDVIGLQEITTGAGILFPLGDFKKLAEEIKLLVAQPEHYNRISQQCQQRASKYDIHHTTINYLNLYKELLR